MKLVIRGLRRILGDTLCKAVPLMPEQLLQCYAMMDSWTTGQLPVGQQQLYVSGHYCESPMYFLPPGLIGPIFCLAKLSYSSNGCMLLSVASSKMVKFKECKLEILVFEMRGSPSCAVTLLKGHFELYTTDGNSPLFRKPGNGGSPPLLYRDVLQALKGLIHSLGMNDSEVGLHSLRRSGAPFLCRIGFLLTDIKCIGDWHSLAVLE